jgi:hypothetical protein
MIQPPIFFTARNGQPFEIRTPRDDEAQVSLDLMVDIAAHSPYILSTPESFKKRELEKQIIWFQDSASSDSALLLST